MQKKCNHKLQKVCPGFKFCINNKDYTEYYLCSKCNNAFLKNDPVKYYMGDNMKSSRISTSFSGSKINPDIQHEMLKACKFCKSEKREFRYVGFFNRVIVKCDDCGYTTKKHNTEYLAMKEWNEVQ